MSTKAVLAAGENPNARDMNGATPLHGAAGRNADTAVIKELVDAGANPNREFVYSNRTPMDLAIEHAANPAVMKVLLDAGGVEPNAQDDDDEAPQEHAA